MQYLVTPKHCIALNSKVATNSICMAIVEAYFPERVELCIIESDYQWRSFVEQTDKPELPVLMLVRDPVERFKAVVSMLNLDAADVIADIKSYEPNYFEPQSLFVKDSPKAKLFAFPSQLKEFCAEAGFKFPLPELNPPKNKKVELTSDQIAFVKDYYAEDVKLFSKVAKI